MAGEVRVALHVGNGDEQDEQKRLEVMMFKERERPNNPRTARFYETDEKGQTTLNIG